MKALKPLAFSCTSCCLWLFLFVSSICTFCLCNHNSDPVLCIATERLALIQLKNNLIDRSNRLSSWLGKDCCSWSGVVCDNFTGHVHEIHLRGPDDGIHGHCHGPYDTDDELLEASKQMLGGTISPALINLTQLRYLDLSCNDFNFTSIPSFIGSFKNLKYLNISSSQFGGEIPHQLGNLSTLRVLDLFSVSFFGELYSSSLKWLHNLKWLEHLNMGRIWLAGASDWLHVISTLPSLLELHLPLCGLTQFYSNQTTVEFTSLTVLDLSDNLFESLLPEWIFSLHNLDVLDLTSCNFYGLDPGTQGGFDSMPSLSSLRVSTNTFMNSSMLLNGLSSLTNLHVLDVGNCNISAPILGSLKNLSLIVHLDLSNNQIVEEIPKSLSNLCNLKYLDLQGNFFFGNVSELLERFCECESPKLELLALRGIFNLVGRLPEKLGRLKNLISLDIAYNQFTGTIPDSLGSLSLLETLQLMLNQLSGPIPDTIGGLSSLNFLDLSSNNLNGSIPEGIGRLGSLAFLALHHNSLEGTLTEEHFFNLTSLKTLWVGDNKLVFKLIVNWIPPFHLDVLRVASCSVGPHFPSWIKSQTNLSELDLASSNISDIIPNWNWFKSSSVTYLNISHNNIQGKLGDVSFLTPGAQLDLSNNNIRGVLPGYFNKPDLDFLDISNNSISGSLNQFLCSGIQEPRQLSVLNLKNNNMSGGITDCWMKWESLVVLNLQKNKFSGNIPSSIGNLPSLKSLDMRDNKLSGNLPVSLLNSKSLILIELAENEFNGRIPGSIGRDNTSLKLLSLGSNKLEGKIPNEICHLKSIQILDLSNNDLSGNLPTCFTNFSVISGSEENSSPFLLYDALFQNQVLGSASLVTKGRVSTYGNILYLVTTIDLSNNNFFGSIPNEIVALSGLRYLNLSQNDLKGRIPNTFSKMRKLESLDLSENHLEGNIPSSLSGLTALSLLNVSYNNLEGKIPTGPQLQTFNESSFKGNALCGDPLPACAPNDDDTEGSNDKQDDSNGIDWTLVIFTLVGLAVGFWIIMAPLLISKRWRNAYYHFLDKMWIKLQDLLLLIYRCFRICGRPPQTVLSSNDHVRRSNLSQFIIDQPKGSKQQLESSNYEASSSMIHSIQQND